MGDVDFALNLCLLRQHERAGLVVGRRDIPAHSSVHTQASAENDVALDGGASADQAID